MTNADKFKSLFGLYATELWAMPEKDFLKWLNSEVDNCSESPNSSDTISRQAAIDALDKEYRCTDRSDDLDGLKTAMLIIENLPSAQPERVWISCDTPPEHHRDVIVRGIEAIGNVTVHKVMQWDVDTWRPTDYAPSVMWKEWSEI